MIRLSNQLNDLHHMNKIYEEKFKMELINQKNEKILKKKYINQINVIKGNRLFWMKKIEN